MGLLYWCFIWHVRNYEICTLTELQRGLKHRHRDHTRGLFVISTDSPTYYTPDTVVIGESNQQFQVLLSTANWSDIAILVRGLNVHVRSPEGERMSPK